MLGSVVFSQPVESFHLVNLPRFIALEFLGSKGSDSRRGQGSFRAQR